MKRWLAGALAPALALGFIGAGLIAPLVVSTPAIRDRLWLVGVVVVGLPLAARTVVGLLRGVFAADVVASLAIVTAVVLAQPLAGLVVALMQTGGEAIERYAAHRASQAVRELEAQAPRIAHRHHSGAEEDIPVDDIGLGDRLLVRPGEMVPCDAAVESGASHLDTARLTGEPMPVAVSAGARIRSGSLNQEGPLVVRATALARESLYAQIVELVRSAQASKAPLQRLADRYAAWFTPATLIVAGLAYLGSGEPLRVLAVLVVATPCPLILATPVAIIGGINRAAKRQIIIRHGGALEQLGRVDTAIFDKTGTLTFGSPGVTDVVATTPFDEATVLRLTGAVEEGSGHLLARTVADAARRRFGVLPHAAAVVEAPGRGVSGTVEDHQVTVGALSLLKERWPEAAERLAQIHDGPGLRAYVAIDGRAAGIISFADRTRPGGTDLLAALRNLGLTRFILLSGDHQPNAEAVGREVGIAEVAGDLLPGDKVARVAQLSDAGHRVLMIGDGVNDAPALSRAAVGLALAPHGGGITAEAADVVLLQDDLSRIPEAIVIARRTLRIAKQSIWAGLGVSGAAMVVAAFGLIPPTVGALLQEAIDVAVILNAVRAAAPTQES